MGKYAVFSESNSKLNKEKSIYTIGLGKKMKTVFNNSMVCHIWANQSQDHGRNSNNSLYFENETIYSYDSHFPIAKIVDDYFGHPTVLFNQASYSNTTAKHQLDCRRAIDSDKYNDFTVLTVNDYEENIPYYIDLINKEIESAKNSKKGNYRDFNDTSESSAMQYIDRAFSIDKTLTKYLLAFNLTSDFQIDKNLVKKIIQKKREIDKKRKTISPYKKARARRLKIRRAIINFINWNTDRNPIRFDRYYNYGKSYHALKRNQDCINYQRTKKAMPKIRESVKAWLSNNDSEILRTIATEGLLNAKGMKRNKLPCLLRIKGDLIETSQGANCPVKFAKLIWLQVAKCRALKTEWTPNGKAINAGHFNVNRIESTGNVKIGCHNIKYGFLKSIARQLNFI